MNIIIERNTFVANECARASVVQDICDAIIGSMERTNEDFKLDISGAHPKMFVGADPNSVYRYKYILDYNRGGVYKRIRSCEMRLAFRSMQEAGYYIYYGSLAYYISIKPYRGDTKAQYTDFTHFID